MPRGKKRSQCLSGLKKKAHLKKESPGGQCGSHHPCHRPIGGKRPKGPPYPKGKTEKAMPRRGQNENRGKNVYVVEVNS